MPLKHIAAAARERFGKDRAPSLTSVWRYWHLLDAQRRGE